MKRNLLLLVILFTILESVHMTTNTGPIGQTDINKIRNVLGRVMSWDGIPKEVLEWLAILNKHLYLLSCLPTVEQGNCFQSPGFCSVDPIKVDGRPIKVHFTVCKRPVKITIRYRIPMPIWAKLLLDADIQPIVILFDTRSKDGLTTIDSSSTAKVRVRGIRLGLVKVTLKINALLRWDCTKPADMVQRVNYNAQYDDGRPGNDFNKIFYKFRIRVEFKVKKFPCFCYRCRKCEDLINVQGHIGEGPKHCETEITRATKWLANGDARRGLKAYLRTFPQFAHCPLVPTKHNLGYRVYMFYFLENPRKYNPGTRFIFSGIKKLRERADLLEFLKDKTAHCLPN